MTVLRIKFDALRRRLVFEKRKAFTNGDVMEWLLDRGFAMTHGAWTASPVQLFHLLRGEIIDSHSVGDAPGNA